MSSTGGAAPSAHRVSRSIPFTPGRTASSHGAAMSAKQYDRYLRRLSAVQHSTRRAMRTLDDSVQEEELEAGEEATPTAHVRPERTRAPPPQIRQLERGGGAPAAAAAPAPESYLQEPSFVLNPLSGRLPSMTPRKLARPRAYDVDDPNASTEGLSAAERLITLDTLDATLQDVLLVEDLLYILIGIEGNYVQFAPDYRPDDLGHRLNGARYVIDAALDASLRELVERILPLASYYTSIYAFVECESGLEYGTVMHALCAAIRTQLCQYEDLVAQMEQRMLSSPDFTLQQLWRAMHPMLRTFGLVHALTSDIASITHADVLPRLEDENLSEGSDTSFDSDASQLERDRRALLGLDEFQTEDIAGGIVKGGEVLSMLWDRLTQLGGDPVAHALYLQLFREASQPYARTLLRWITSGVLLDPYEEFMVVEDARVTRASLESDPTDEYWERRYMLRDERYLAQREQLAREGDMLPADDVDEARGELTGGAKIPAFLQPWKHKILLAGKYLNAIRECGIDVSNGQSERVQTLFGLQDAHVEAYLALDAKQERVEMDNEAFATCIKRAYQRANAALLCLLKDDKDIIARLCSLKHYFFFAQSDFLQTFMDQSGHELRKMVDPFRVRETTLLRLQTQLDMALGSSDSVGFLDPYREDLRVDLAKERAYDQLQRIADTKGVVEVAKLRAKQQAERQQHGTREVVMYLLQFDVQVQFPVSLVISKKNILRWQFIHRCLLLFKQLERALTEVWVEQTMPAWRRKDRRAHAAPMEAWKMRIHLLRQRMLLLVQQLLAFYTSEIIEPHWHALERQLHAARSVDQFMKHHFDFLNTCRKECMLTDYRYLECHRKLMNTITAFTESRTRFTEQYEAMQRAVDDWHRLADDTAPPPVLLDDRDILSKIEASWNKHSRVRSLTDPDLPRRRQLLVHHRQSRGPAAGVSAADAASIAQAVPSAEPRPRAPARSQVRITPPGSPSCPYGSVLECTEFGNSITYSYCSLCRLNVRMLMRSCRSDSRV